jgi:predicted amidohydrolase YtcJ
LITLAIVNARVWTGNPRQPWASGIAVDDAIVRLVASSAEVAKLVDKSTHVIDAKGKFVRNRTGSIERYRAADFVIADAYSNDIDADVDESSVVVEIAAGKIIFERGRE